MVITVVGDSIQTYAATDYGSITGSALSDLTKSDAGFSGSSDGVFTTNEAGSYVLYYGPSQLLKYITLSPDGNLDGFTVQATKTGIADGQSLFNDCCTLLNNDEKSYYMAAGAAGIQRVTMPTPTDIANIVNEAAVDIGAPFVNNWNITSTWIDPNDTTFMWVGGESGTTIKFAKFATNA